MIIEELTIFWWGVALGTLGILHDVGLKKSLGSQGYHQLTTMSHWCHNELGETFWWSMARLGLSMHCK